MIFQKSIFLTLISLFAASVDSFVIGNPSLPCSFAAKASTCLRAEEENETETQGEEAAAGADDILNSPAFLSRKIDVLKSDIAKAEEDIEAATALAEAGKAEWAPQLEDLQREYQNIQERMSSQNKQGDTMATTMVVREMLELLDNFDRAFGAVKPETDGEVAVEAEYKELYDAIVATFDRLGVQQVETLGTEFDYEVHQAVMQQPSDEYDEGIVCQEFQKGFKIGDTLIRAAMVAVAA